MTKVVSNREICFNKAVLLLLKHFSQNFASHGVFYTLSITIWVKNMVERQTYFAQLEIINDTVI